MPLPTVTDLLTLDYDDLGMPFIRAEAKALSSETLDYDDRGMPFVAAAGGGFFSRYYYDMLVDSRLGS